MSKWGPRANEKPSPAKRPKTFWLNPNTIAKLKAALAGARNPEEIIEDVRTAIDKKIDELYKDMLEKELSE